MTSPAKDFVAGCAGGMAQVLIGQPFDMVKIRLQAASKELYRNAFDCFQKIIRNEGGLRTLWRGTLPPLLGVGAAVSIQFGVNEKTKQQARKLIGLPELALHHLFSCGMVAGVANSLVSTPVEHTRIRMQIQGTTGVSASKFVRNMIQSHGFTGLYKGGVPTVWRESIAMGIYFSMYEWIKAEKLKKEAKIELDMLEIAMAGSCAGMALWFATFPIDIVKTKIQTDCFCNPMYRGTWDCFMKTFKSGGVTGFYKGLSPCLLRAIPANGATFIVYEAASKLLSPRSNLGKQY